MKSTIIAIVGLCVTAPFARAVDVDTSKLPPPATRKIDFVKDVQPIFAKTCYGCHGAEKQKSNYRIDARPYAMKGGDIGKPILPGDSAKSPLIHYVGGVHPEITMPPKGDPLSADQVSVLRAWIDQGAPWPVEADKIKVVDKSDWWSFKPIVRPAPPEVAADRARVRNPIDNFILAKLEKAGLRPSPEADRRTLIRRVSYDLTGLPPSPDEVDAFVADPDPQAYEKLIDRLLASPRYGERWGRHWLDVVHYGDTHGYDKDKVRPNAWPYRDYVIRSLNADKPYDRFVKEQLAGDALYPNTPDGIVALGFIAAGPWDFVGHVELREGTIDKLITRNLDRDDMVTVTMNTFTSLTAQCARCHNHKFDPISQEDYYSLQAVFADVDRADRPFEVDANTAVRRKSLQDHLDQLAAQRIELDKTIVQKAGPELAAIDARLTGLATLKAAKGGERPEFGYHSQISAEQVATKWVQIDLGISTAVDRILVVACNDNFNNIGAGFGFPLRYKIELSDDPQFKTNVLIVADHTKSDVINPGIRPQVFAADRKAGQYVRFTATKLAPRQNDYILALAEVTVLTADGVNVALGRGVTALDSIEAPVRWRKANLVDGYYYGVSKDASQSELAKIAARREEILAKSLDAPTRAELARLEKEVTTTEQAIKALPARSMVYAATTKFNPKAPNTPNAKSRPVYLLHRGSEKSPRELMGPGTISLAHAPELQSRFATSADQEESQRRADLANWVTDRKNPLTWRSIVNRVWQYHFGRGIVESANDFGHMGTLPSHPELLDYLAAEFRDGGQSIPTPGSLKQLHRLIVTSATYRQSSAHDPDNARVDSGNQYLWRMNRARLEAETLRDSVLLAAGKLDLKMGGPGFRLFGFQDDHSPHYKYAEHDPDDPASHRRSVYRFAVRSVPDPFMETLDCADPSHIVPKRIETLTALQALSLMNNKFMVRMSEHFAQRLEKQFPDTPTRIDAACRQAYGRPATELERKTLGAIAQTHGLPNACRLILNSNEFVFID